MSEPAATGSPAATTSSLQRDVISAYAATGSKILSWVVVLGLVYRFAGKAEFAMLALVRGTIGILNYTSLGLSPAMVRILSEARRERPASVATSTTSPTDVLSYYTPEPEEEIKKVFSNGMVIALITGAIGIVASLVYALQFGGLYTMPTRLKAFMFMPVFFVGVGTVLRLTSDVAGSVLQANGRIARDNWRLVEADVIWVALCVLFLPVERQYYLEFTTFWYALSGAVLVSRRSHYASKLTNLRWPRWRWVDEATIRRLLGFGSLVLFAQLADYLYAPCDFILINKLIGWEAVEAYTPAMTIDSGLLLLVTGLSSVILPRTAIAHTAGEMERVRRYYIWGTVFSAFLLLVAAGAVWLLSPILFQLWLGSSMPATQAILPLVLIHTVVGGSSAVGRSILLGMGRVRVFTMSVLLAGVANVVLSYIFVRHLDLGLKGIVLGTIVVVVVRAGLWMPWYVLRTLRNESR